MENYLNATGQYCFPMLIKWQKEQEILSDTDEKGKIWKDKCFLKL